jgi:uncharacterized membrane protein YccF (DUF307 family)
MTGIFTAVQFARLSKFSIWPYGMKIVSKKSLKRKRKQERAQQAMEMGTASSTSPYDGGASAATPAQAY